jgi:hypothetical protein
LKRTETKKGRKKEEKRKGKERKRKGMKKESNTLCRISAPEVKHGKYCS